MFNILTTNRESVVCLIPEGRLDTVNSGNFSSTLEPLLEREDYLIIEFSKCNYLSSSGIRLLMVATKKLSAKGGCLVIASLQPEIHMVLEMAGLIPVFNISRDEEGARRKILLLRDNFLKTSKDSFGDNIFSIEYVMNNNPKAFVWDKDIAGYNELILSSGIGSPAESLEDDLENRGIFVVVGKCAGFIPFDAKRPSDFRVVKEPAGGAVYIDKAFSYLGVPSCKMTLTSPDSIPMTDLKNAIDNIIFKGELKKLKVAAVADFNDITPSLAIIFNPDKEDTGIFPATVFGAKFSLNELRPPEPDESFIDFANRSLTIQNIEEISPPDTASKITRAVVWLFYSDKWEDPMKYRIKVETNGDLKLSPYKKLLAKRLYEDSDRVVIKMLHGGYSAETFQVDSYDKQGRKMRPTVLKIAGRDIISREALRCQKYSLPYIMNNSAMVLGTSFFCNMGALRYNFVGIGGEETRLEWLTNYYNTWPVEKLDPLFDKIFLQILKPWYGQPVAEKIFPYKDHDPRTTFFPKLCEVAENVLSISSRDKFINLKGINRVQINPYWFLKHEYKKREDIGMDYFTSVCHGDLNMQNILLDKDMNVYLIDFSETRPRAVISDFARLEAIFMVESAPLATIEDFINMVEFASDFYDVKQLDKLPESSNWRGEMPEILRRNVNLSIKMRKYAIESVSGNNNIVPYYLAFLEWVLPIVCYGSQDLKHKKFATFVAGKVCEKIIECGV